jgi:DNA-binding FadR family transcriptional regulator
MTLAFPDPMINLERVMTPRLLGGRTLNDIFELRLVLEIGMSELLFKRKSSDNLAQLKAIVEKEELATSKKEILKYDIEFHSMLYKISGNETMLRFQKMLIPIFNHVFKELNLEEQPPRNNQITHRDLYNSLNHGNPDDFRTKMKEHLSPYLNNIV